MQTLMTPLFKKLNYKNQVAVVALNAPKSLAPELEATRAFADVFTDLKKVKAAEFVICFATKQTEVDAFAKAVDSKLNGDAIFWICYPKGTSKNYTCDFNRDTGWALLGKLNYEPVRQVAIDDDWSALRFRKVEFIKKITRRESFALSAAAKKRTTQKGK